MSSFVCGFGAGVLQVVPIAKSFACCLIIPAAVVLALVLDQKAKRSAEKIIPSKAVIIGILTGVYAALFGSFFDIFITLITKNNDILAAIPELQKMISGSFLSAEVQSQVIGLMNKIVTEISETGFSLLYTFSVLLNNFIFNTIFGIAGGLIGMQILNSKRQTD